MPGEREIGLDLEKLGVRYGFVDYRLSPSPTLSSEGDKLSDSSSRLIVNLFTLILINFQQERGKVGSASLLTDF